MITRFVPPKIIGQCVVFSSMIIIVLGFIMFEPNSIPWIRESSTLTINTLKITFIGFILFLAIFVLLIGVLILLYYLVRQNKQRFLLFIVIIFALIVVANSIPMLIYLRISYSFSNSFFSAATSLVTANAMAYYFFHGFVSELWEESQKLYVISATFREKSVIGQLKERATWLLMGYLSPLFYYILSFTLFSDILLSRPGEGDRGIVRELFIFLQHTDTAWSNEFWVYLATMLAIILPIRIMLDWAVFAWEKKKSL